MKASSKIKTVTGVMMVMVMVGLTACGKNEAVETQSTKDDISNYYQEEMELDKESADELAEIAMEINDIEDSEGAEEEAEAAEAEEMEPINSCFDEAIDNCFSYYSAYHKLNLDKSMLFMTEEEIVEAIGKPDAKEDNRLYWKTDGEHLFFNEPNTVPFECYPVFVFRPARYYEGQLDVMGKFYAFNQKVDNSVTDIMPLGHNADDLKKYYEGIPASPWSFFEGFLLNEDGSLAYDADQVTDWVYDDYVEALGSKGIMVDTDTVTRDDVSVPTITIAWYFPADGTEHIFGDNDGATWSMEDTPVVISATFYAQTGENREKYAPSFRVRWLNDYSSTEQP